jgi:hypothetical protein
LGLNIVDRIRDAVIAVSFIDFALQGNVDFGMRDDV